MPHAAAQVCKCRHALGFPPTSRCADRSPAAYASASEILPSPRPRRPASPASARSAPAIRTLFVAARARRRRSCACSTASPGSTSGRDSCSAGHRPNRTPVSKRQRHAESQHRQIDLDRRLMREGILRQQRHNHRQRFVGQQHTQRGARSAKAAETRSAVAGSIRRRLAPIAARTANSCCRAVPRASSRIETLPHPIASSSATAPNSRYSVPPSCLTKSSFSPTTWNSKVLVRKMLRRLLGELFDQRLKRRIGRLVGHSRLQPEPRRNTLAPGPASLSAADTHRRRPR